MGPAPPPWGHYTIVSRRRRRGVTVNYNIKGGIVSGRFLVVFFGDISALFDKSEGWPLRDLTGERSSQRLPLEVGLTERGSAVALPGV